MVVIDCLRLKIYKAVRRTLHMESVDTFRALGLARVEFAKAARTEEDWKKWQEPQNKFAFEWGSCWNNTIEYKVSDYEAEVGFFIDVLGCDCNTISSDYAMFMGPQKEFFLSVRKPKDGESFTAPDAIAIEFMIKDMKGTVERLKSRGVRFTIEPRKESADSPMLISSFKTPHGIKVCLWSMENPVS
jgi:hypothetical protein